MRRLIIFALISALVVGCSTTGGIYSKDDPNNSEFSAGNTILSVLAAVAVAAVARGGGGGGGGNSYSNAAAVDSEWAWDQFYNEHYQLVWACRGIQTGQFADQWRCQYKSMNDLTWPSKAR